MDTQAEDLTQEVDTHIKMSDSAGGAESGGVAGAGQDAEADSEPPQQAPPLPDDGSLEVRETPEEGSPPAAKRPKMSAEERELGQVAEPVEMHGETPGHQDDPDSAAQSRLSLSMKLLG